MGGHQQQRMCTGQRALTHVQLSLPPGDLLKQYDGALPRRPLGGVRHCQLVVDGAGMDSHLKNSAAVRRMLSSCISYTLAQDRLPLRHFSAELS